MMLGTYDVSPAHAQRLRDRCHARLRARARQSFDRVERDAPVRDVVGPVVGGAWCLAYLVAILRFAAAVYGW